MPNLFDWSDYQACHQRGCRAAAGKPCLNLRVRVPLGGTPILKQQPHAYRRRVGYKPKYPDS